MAENQNPEQIARDNIDALLRQAGWSVQNANKIDLNAGLGQAVREYQTDAGPADYVLFVDKKAAGVIEAKLGREPHPVVYNEKIPPEFFDFIFVVSDYSHEKAVADGVNVGNEVYVIETRITKQGAQIAARQQVERREKLTRKKRWEQQDEDAAYSATQLDRDIVNPDQLELTLTSSLQQAEALRQSILKRAFAGRLVPQDARDEPAAALLARIKAERAKIGNNAGTSRRTRKVPA